MLNSKFGPEIHNTYSEGGLNRLSYLRENYDFIYRVIKHPNTRFLLYGDGLKTLVSEDGQRLEWSVKYNDIADIINADLAYGASEDEIIKRWNSQTDAVGIGRACSVFLGVNSGVSAEILWEHGPHTIQGQAVFAVDVSTVKILNAELKQRVDSAVNRILARSRSNWVHGRLLNLIAAEEYAIMGQGRMYIDWNNRNRFCGGCGKPNMSVNAGCKLICPGIDAGHALPPCDTRGVVTNLSFPRTDACVICAVLNYSCTKLLLGSGKRFPHRKLYSCLAGFLEPAESIEECVRREVHEESGVQLGRVIIHSSQPWPYPANIMLGCIAQVVDAGAKAHTIDLGLDPELNDAKWIDIEEVRNALDYAANSGKFGAAKDGNMDRNLYVPPPSAIAHVLLRAAVDLATEETKRQTRM